MTKENRKFRRQKQEAGKYFQKLIDNFKYYFYRNSFSDRGELKFYQVVDDKLQYFHKLWVNKARKLEANPKNVLKVDHNAFMTKAEEIIEASRESFYLSFLQKHLDEKYGYEIAWEDLQEAYDPEVAPEDKAIEIVSMQEVACAV